MTWIETPCTQCGHILNIGSNSWEFECPKCGNTIERRDANEYCKCTHQKKDHRIPDLMSSNSCLKCNCQYFDTVKMITPEEYDKQFSEKDFCKHLFKKMKPDKDKLLWYKCINCGSEYVNLKPTSWQTIDDDSED